MKTLLVIGLCMSSAIAATPAKDMKTTPPTFEYEEYQPNDGSARAGNPGSFTSKGPESTVPETNLEMKNIPEAELDQEIQAEEADLDEYDEFDDEVLK